MGELHYTRATRLNGEGAYLAAALEYAAAQAVFPLPHRVNESRSAVLGRAMDAPPRLVVDALDRALSVDPYSPSLLYFKAMHQMRASDWAAAWHTLRALERVGPGWEYTRYAMEVYRSLARPMRRK